MAKPRETQENVNAETAPAAQTAKAEPVAKLYSITYLPPGTGPGTRHGAPEEMHVGLPNGGIKFMNANFPEEVPDGSVAPTPENPRPMRKSTVEDAGYPYAEALLSDHMAQEWAAQYALHGLKLTLIAKSKFKRHPLKNEDEE